MDLKLVIYTTCYNCKDYIKKCVESVLRQDYVNWEMYITDDMSTDGTLEILKEIETLDSRIHVIYNKVKNYQLGNYYQIANLPEVAVNAKYLVAVELDGDDRFAHDHVLSRVNEWYQDKNVWMTHGSLRYWNPKIDSYTEDVDLRFNRPITSIEGLTSEKAFIMHLRTWRIRLQYYIPFSWMIDSEKGRFYSTGGDAAFFIPMAELCGLERIKFIKEVLVDYNNENPINDFKVDYDLQKALQAKMNDRGRLSPLPFQAVITG